MPIDIPPPPAFVQPVAAAPSPMVPSIRSYAAGPARCGGETVTPLRVVDPVPDGMVLPPQGSSAASRVQAPVTLAFEVDSEGRPVGIARAPENNWMADDVEPAFAAWRFPAGAPRRHCTIRFESRDIEAAEAEPSLLHAYLATRASRLFRHSPPEVSRGFGVLAKSIVERSRRRPAGYGGTGCLELVRFRMPPAEPAAAEE